MICRSTLAPLFLVVAALASTLAHAYDETGHQVVAAVAWPRLNKTAQTKLDLLFPMNSNPKLHVVFTFSKKASTPDNKYPKTVYNHITIANWMDDLRDNSVDKPMEEWHFIDRPFFDGVEPRLALPEVPNAREKLIENINLLRKLRHFDTADKDHADDKTKAAYAAAVVIHLIADVHQPLHCAKRFTKEKPNGDVGGNLFYLTGLNDVTNLHTLWDSSGGLFDWAKLGRDYDDAQQKSLADFVDRVLKRWDPTTHPEWRNFNPEEWVEESYTIAKTQVYQGITVNTTPDEDYLKKAKQISAERIATAGFRLAEVLNQALSDE